MKFDALKILVLPSWYPDSSNDIDGSFFREQGIALAKRGVKVGVIHPRLRSLRRPATILTGPNGITIQNDEGVQTFRSHGMAWFPRMPRLSRWYWIRHGLRLFEQYINDHGMPDIVHVHSMLNAGVLALELHRRHGVPYLITEHSAAFSRNLLSDEQMVLASSVATHAQRRFAVSKPFCELLIDQLGDGAGEWEEMPNIVNQAFLEHELQRRSQKKQSFRFLTIALLTENKATANLLQSFAMQFAGQDGVYLDIGGDGPERPRLESQATELGIQEQVRFLGSLSRAQVRGAMADADVFVLPSHYETFGVVVVEALALGKPVIATRCGGPESIIKSGDGVLVPTHDVDALAKAMAEVFANVGQYDPVDIRKRCRQRYSEDTVVARLTKVYREVVESRVC